MEFLWIIVAVALLPPAMKYLRFTVLEYEKGLWYTRGRFRSVLGAGQYWQIPGLSRIVKIDMRKQFVSIPGQEILSADGVSLKASLAAYFEVVDPARAVNTIANYQKAIYLELQLALREIVGGLAIETVLIGRDDMSRKLMERTESKVADLGVRLIRVNVKDITFPGALKETFAQVAKARQEGQAALERARGETAALRNLANAARMLDDNPSLMQLRLLQTIGGASGNTIMLGVAPGAMPAAAREPKQPPHPQAG